MNPATLAAALCCEFVPYAPEFLAKCSQNCPCCAGGGIGLGYGFYGRVCPCVFRCAYCDVPMPVDDDHFGDEGRPLKYDGLDACPDCRAKFAAEDAAEKAG